MKRGARAVTADIVSEVSLLANWGAIGAPSASPYHRLMIEVIVGVDGDGVRVPQERRCSWGAPSFRVSGVLTSIGLLGMEEGGHGGR